MRKKNRTLRPMCTELRSNSTLVVGKNLRYIGSGGASARLFAENAGSRHYNCVLSRGDGLRQPRKSNNSQGNFPNGYFQYVANGAIAITTSAHDP